MKHLALFTAALFASSALFAQGWIGASGPDVLYPVNTGLGLSPLHIGIGTNTPTHQLHTNEGVRFEGLTPHDKPDRFVVQDNAGVLYWFPFSSIGGGNDWSLTGNAGTTPGFNYLGTSDNQRLVFATNATEKMTILPSGNVGIATSAPDARLHLGNGMLKIDGAITSADLNTTNFFAGGPGTGLQLHNETDYMGMLLVRNANDDHDGMIYWGDNPGTEDLLFSRANWNTPTGGVHNFMEMMRLTGGGNLGIGTSTPAQRLTVFNGTTTGTYTVTGWVHSSDRRLKQDIAPIADAMSIVNRLEGVYYKWIGNKEAGRQVGFIAQDVQKVLPEVVVGQEGDIEKGETLGMAYQNIVPVLVEALKEKDREITELKQRLERIERALGSQGKLQDGDNAEGMSLQQNVPNPFTAHTSIPYSIDRSGIVLIELFTAEGVRLRTLENARKEKGSHSVSLDGSGLAAGTYIYTLSLNGRQLSRKAIRL